MAETTKWPRPVISSSPQITAHRHRHTHTHARTHTHTHTHTRTHTYTHTHTRTHTHTHIHTHTHTHTHTQVVLTAARPFTALGIMALIKSATNDSKTPGWSLIIYPP